VYGHPVLSTAGHILDFIEIAIGLLDQGETPWFEGTPHLVRGELAWGAVRKAARHAYGDRWLPEQMGRREWRFLTAALKRAAGFVDASFARDRAVLWANLEQALAELEIARGLAAAAFELPEPDVSDRDADDDPRDLPELEPLPSLFG
jgi:hypothetical protein